MAHLLRHGTSVTAPQPGDDEAARGRIWHLFVGAAESGSFTDLRRRSFHPGERLIDDQGNRRVVVAVLDQQALRLGVSAPL